MKNACPRCAATLEAADDIGAGVFACGCGAYFVTHDARLRLLAFLRVSPDVWLQVLQQGKRGPNCTCGAVMLTATLKGVTVDGCDKCGGLLLDPGELRALSGLTERKPPAVASAVDAMPARDNIGMFVPPRQALNAFVGSALAFHLLQAKGEVAGLLAVNQPFQWTVNNGMLTGSIGPDDNSTARQLLAMVTGNLVSSRFVLKDARDNPMLAFVRRTNALLSARIAVHYTDNDAAIGHITKGIAGISLDVTDADDNAVVGFEKHLGDLWGFTVVDPSGRKLGDVTRGFGNVEFDVGFIGGGLQRSVRRDDFELSFVRDVSDTLKALAIAATFLVAHTSSGPAGLTALFR